MKVAVSYLKSDNYKKCIKEIDNSIADYIHVDLCDGKYVETKNFTIGEVIDLLKFAQKPLDIHLMVEEPIKYVEKLALLNVETITIHPLACKDTLQTINFIKDMGLKVGVAINPDEDINLIHDYLDLIDEVLVMSVVPGKGGQTFIPEVISTIDEINSIKENYNFIVAVDGGINFETINYLNDKNIDLVISGSFITNSHDYDEQINLLK